METILCFKKFRTLIIILYSNNFTENKIWKKVMFIITYNSIKNNDKSYNIYIKILKNIYIKKEIIYRCIKYFAFNNSTNTHKYEYEKVPSSYKHNNISFLYMFLGKEQHNHHSQHMLHCHNQYCIPYVEPWLGQALQK